MRIGYLGLAVAFAVTPMAAQAPLWAQDSVVTQSADVVDPISAAKSRAKLLWLYDQAAWHSTDVMLAMQKRAIPAEKEALNTVRGWVVTPDAKGWLVVYYAPAAEGINPKAVFSAIWTGKGDKVVDAKWLTAQSYAWSAEQLALVQAASAVDAAALKKCSRHNLNRVIMPDPAVSGQILVYHMTPQTTTGIVPFGLHYRAVVRNGAVAEEFQGTKSCIALPAVGPDGKKPPAIAISNFTTATPTEFHLFGARMGGLPVVTMDRQDKANFVVGWKKDEPFVEPLSGLQDLDKFID